MNGKLTYVSSTRPSASRAASAWMLSVFFRRPYFRMTQRIKDRTTEITRQVTIGK
jgi:hypothetical protein